jgi:hypothetical protein
MVQVYFSSLLPLATQQPPAPRGVRTPAAMPVAALSHLRTADYHHRP